MLAKVIDFQDDYCLCQYQDYDDHRRYGYLNSMEIDDIRMPVQDKVSIGDELEIEEMYETHGDIILTSKGIYGKDFSERSRKYDKFDPVKGKVIKKTLKGGIIKLDNGLAGYVPGHFEVGDKILGSVRKMSEGNELVLLVYEALLNEMIEER